MAAIIRTSLSVSASVLCLFNVHVHVTDVSCSALPLCARVSQLSLRVSVSPRCCLSMFPRPAGGSHHQSSGGPGNARRRPVASRRGAVASRRGGRRGGRLGAVSGPSRRAVRRLCSPGSRPVRLACQPRCSGRRVAVTSLRHGPHRPARHASERRDTPPGRRHVNVRRDTPPPGRHVNGRGDTERREKTNRNGGHALIAMLRNT